MTNQPPEKLPPNSPDAEMAVLGSILTDGDRLFEVSSFLQPSDFFIVKNAKIYETILKLSEARQEIDKLTVIEALKVLPNGLGGNWLESIGGSAYLTELTNCAGDYQHIETYARLVERAAIRRRLLAAASAIAQTALEENSPIEQVVNHAESALFKVTERQQENDTESAGQIASRYYDRVEALYQKKATILGLPTGFTRVDQMLSGFQKGNLYIIGAPPRVGKTALTLHFAMNNAKHENEKGIHDTPALFLSLEMTRESLINRLIGSYMNLNTMDLQLGNLNEDQWNRFTTGLAELRKWPLFIDDNPDLTIERLRGKARRFVHREHIQAIYLDYLQLMHAPGIDNREQEISAISRGLKLLAKELDIPIVACAQLNRMTEQRQDHRPQLSDLRESGAIEQNADVVIFLYREDMYNDNSERPNQCDLICAKHRNGPTFVETLFFKKEYTQFTSVDRHKLDLALEWNKPSVPAPKWIPPPKLSPVKLRDGTGDSDDGNGEDEGK